MKQLIFLLAFALLIPASSIAASHSKNTEHKAAKAVQKEARKSSPIVVPIATTTTSVETYKDAPTTDVSVVVVGSDVSTTTDVALLVGSISLNSSYDITIDELPITFTGTFIGATTTPFQLTNLFGNLVPATTSTVTNVTIVDPSIPTVGDSISDIELAPILNISDPATHIIYIRDWSF